MTRQDRMVFERIYRLVERIPRGKVASYGQIARMLGQPHGARTVGWALRALPDGTTVPWHRVLNSQGRISAPWGPAAVALQRALLEEEGVVFDDTGRVDLTRFGWAGPEEE